MVVKSQRQKSRREFLAGAGAFTLAAAVAGPASAAMGPDDKFDLVTRARRCSIRANRCAADAPSAFAMA
jgi:hypothetical protein